MGGGGSRGGAQLEVGEALVELVELLTEVGDFFVERVGGVFGRHTKRSLEGRPEMKTEGVGDWGFAMSIYAIRVIGNPQGIFGCWDEDLVRRDSDLDTTARRLQGEPSTKDTKCTKF